MTRRALAGLGALAVGIGLIVVFALVVNSRDDATTGERAGVPGAPGQAQRADQRRLVADGNVVVVHPPADRAALRTLVQEITGVPPGDEQQALVRAGQGVVLQSGATALQVYGGDRVLQAAGPTDPQLRRFVEFWLGRTLDG